MVIEGELQMKLGYDQTTLQLIVTIVCASGLSLRQTGHARNPYAKVSICYWNMHRNGFKCQMKLGVPFTRSWYKIKKTHQNLGQYL